MLANRKRLAGRLLWARAIAALVSTALAHNYVASFKSPALPRSARERAAIPVPRDVDGRVPGNWSILGPLQTGSD
ncbi:hypothetical protein ZHAS_00021080 [Anopheles sinensis]|uniref:Uncharacterized protein n=1 Tax=Anopheles sinensis TaxID=74873 RepID=A0A084WRG6_ANOSI|nr:hypothetical protein ZHAS_00021080 [Anopheles sinensis]